jgi:hypothetical protein
LYTNSMKIKEEKTPYYLYPEQPPFFLSDTAYNLYK